MANGKIWTPREEDELFSFIENGYTFKELTKIFKRTPDALRLKYTSLKKMVEERKVKQSLVKEDVVVKKNKGKYPHIMIPEGYEVVSNKKGIITLKPINQTHNRIMRWGAPVSTGNKKYLVPNAPHTTTMEGK